MRTSRPLRVVAALALEQWREQWRNRAFLAALVFAGLLLYASFLLGVLAADEETRALLDFGLSFIELMGLGLAAFGAATGVLREMETKVIYLILTRPVPRWTYLLGRYLGLLLTTSGAVLFMAAAHLAVLTWRGWLWQGSYLLGLFGILLKLGIACALATFLALFTTSALSALALTAVFWTLGHFIPEIGFLAGQPSRGPWLKPLAAVALFLPNLDLLNFRDRIGIPQAVFPAEPLLGAVLYALAYSSACLILGYALFRKKEF